MNGDLILLAKASRLARHCPRSCSDRTPSHHVFALLCRHMAIEAATRRSHWVPAETCRKAGTSFSHSLHCCLLPAKSVMCVGSKCGWSGAVSSPTSKEDSTARASAAKASSACVDDSPFYSKLVFAAPRSSFIVAMAQLCMRSASDRANRSGPRALRMGESPKNALPASNALMGRHR